MLDSATGDYWECPPGLTNQQCWENFVQHFNLRDVLNESYALAEDKTIYFRPYCKEMELGGQSGGQNYGILAKIPVLVK
jgi:hypothetical protein